MGAALYLCTDMAAAAGAGGCSDAGSVLWRCWSGRAWLEEAQGSAVQAGQNQGSARGEPGLG